GLATAAAPLIRYYLKQRCASGKEDPARLDERFGLASRPRPLGALVWVHCASVGEAVSVLALIERMLAARPALNVLVTTGTVTSARLLARRLPPRAFHQYVPVDHAGWARRFVRHWRPDLALWVESELWPNLIGAAAGAGVTLALINARMSDASFRRWRRAPFLIRPLLQSFALCLGQDERQSERLAALGAPAVRSVGNLKFAAAPLPVDESDLAALRAAIAGRPAWIAASTHPGEEELIARAHRQLAPAHPGLLTVIVPRHPDRGPAIAAALRAPGIVVARRGAGEGPAAAQVYVADTMGELGLFYRLAPLAFIGGSLVPHGGHNPLEAAVLGAAALAGPHTHNFASVTEEMKSAGGLVQVADAEGLARELDRLLGDEPRRRKTAAAGRAVALARAHVLDAVLAEIAPWLDAAERRHANGGDGAHSLADRRARA
ncbi:MAG: 3-deoxy-D-manno-octulosonic acid transferase, partial [Rhodospirillales bacterium]